MGPYLAVIGDSFRAAFSSRILWVALVAIYIFLFAIAPIGYREVYTTTIRWFDIPNGTRMKAMLAQGIQQSTDNSASDSATDGLTPAGMIARAMPEEIQSNLRKVAEGEEVRIQLHLLADSLNALLEQDDWYDVDVWKKTNPLRELRELDAMSDDALTDDLKKRRARLRIEAALPGVFENRGARSIALTYAGFDFPAVLQIDPAQFKLLLNHIVLRIIIDWVLGFVMIFLGILVTASIIPDMLQPGSLHLLLSKPISRSWLFIAKFIGGCAFVLVCVTQLIVGLWLISGFRLGIWNERLLLCIPVCVFLFAVFYSVSAVAGLRWRSPILSIGLANAFGALCLFIGVAGGVSDGFVTDPDRIEALVVSGDTLIASTRGADLRRFDRSNQTWVDLFADENGRGDRILSPVKLADGRIVTARVRGGRMNLFGSGVTPLLVLDESEDWRPTPSIELPTATSQLFKTSQGELVALNSSELMICDAATVKSLGATNDAANESTKKEPLQNLSANWLPKLLKMMGGATEGFKSLAPREVSVSPPRSVAFTADGDSVFVYSSGRLLRLDRPSHLTTDDAKADDRKAGDDSANLPWTIAEKTNIDVGNNAVWVRMIDDEVAVLRSDAAPLFFAQSLAPIAADEPPSFDFSSFKISDVIPCGDTGQLAILSSDGSVYLLDRRTSSTSIKPIGGISDVDAGVWDDESKRLWVSHRVDRLSAIDVTSQAIVERLSPKLAGWRLVDKYAVTPLRFVTPQTGELGETIASIVSGESTIQFPFDTETIQTERYNIWRPVLTCAGFIVAMLVIGCIFFSKADF